MKRSMQIQNNSRRLASWLERTATMAGRIALCALVSQLGAQELANPITTDVVVSLSTKTWHPIPAAPGLRALFDSQEPVSPGSSLTSAGHDLTVAVAEGEGAINSIGQGTSRSIVIRVQDAKGVPVEGAVVTFLLPTDGPSGTFPNGTRNLSVTTDDLGRAVATGFTPTPLAGVMEIKVTVTVHGETAHAIVHQTNSNSNGASGGEAVPAPVGGGTSSAATGKKSSNTMLLVLVGVGAAAGVGAALALKGGSSASTNNSSTTTTTIPSVGISVGSGSFSAPPH